MSFGSRPGSSAVILYAFSSSATSTTGGAKLNVLSWRNIGSASNMRRSEGMPKAPEKRSNKRSISLRNERHASCAGAGVVFFTSTGVLAIAISIVPAVFIRCEEIGRSRCSRVDPAQGALKRLAQYCGRDGPSSP